MGLKNNETQFYIFELKLSLTGRFVQNDPELTDEEKKRNKRTFFDSLLKNDIDFKKKYTIENLLNYLNSTQLTHSLENVLIKFNDFQFIDEQKTVSACLFFYANRNIHANDLYNFNTNSERKIEQQDYEGVRLVSHIIMKVIGSKITKSSHLFVALEARPYIYPNQIQKGLNAILRDWTTEYQRDERKISVHPQVEVLALKGETLEEILKSGKVIGIKLTRNHPVNQNQDESPFVYTGKSELVLTPPKKIDLTPDEQLKGLATVVRTKKLEYDRLKVTVDLSGTTKTNEYELSNQTTPEGILQEYFFHKEILEFDENVIDVNYTHVIPKVVQKVLHEVLTNEKLKIFD
ncbi:MULTISPECIES: hypothetical protein [Legionella]|uniref:Uncharacterized protein n=2 Tax=Legionella TaxID=445 RepID=A0A0W1AC82_9GAMM|nr:MULTISPECIES: hypothetical protein [Legionella]KTD54219.1 hypothetical protein Lsai_3041 [Legionella sainthelensi]KTD78945.1 hypothetical protein Lwal_1715 [Legionella waltersii]SNV07361.1 Uncharacterised protein [Legionella waltersii]VEH29831.1 Uncharacterised protein [Legionella sainthelensi]GAN26120.1 hypothetical protein lpymg_01002 [Legionella pneumophila]